MDSGEERARVREPPLKSQINVSKRRKGSSVKNRDDSGNRKTDDQRVPQGKGVPSTKES